MVNAFYDCMEGVHIGESCHIANIAIHTSAYLWAFAIHRKQCLFTEVHVCSTLVPAICLISGSAFRLYLEHSPLRPTSLLLGSLEKPLVGSHPMGHDS